MWHTLHHKLLRYSSPQNGNKPWDRTGECWLIPCVLSPSGMSRHNKRPNTHFLLTCLTNAMLIQLLVLILISRKGRKLNFGSQMEKFFLFFLTWNHTIINNSVSSDFKYISEKSLQKYTKKTICQSVHFPPLSLSTWRRPIACSSKKFRSYI